MAKLLTKEVPAWRWILSTGVLVALLFVLAFKLGLFDSFVRDRSRILAQYNEREWANHWMGVEIQQYPNDLMVYQEIITELKPDLIIETGTWNGGLTLYFANLLEQVNPQGKVITVDISREAWEEKAAKVDLPGVPRLRERIEFIHGSSTAPEVVSQIAAQVKDRRCVLVILDSAHTKDHVLQEMRLYSPFVTPGSYLIVNDTHLDYTGSIDNQPGPMAAIREFMKDNKDFSLDPSRNRFVVSCNHSGFLKKK
jgi:cephalosporin hydroxylase